MTPWTVHQILEATGGQLVRGNPDTRLNGISIDSRRLIPGDAYLAIHGTKFDGHVFLDDAAHNGAACLIVAKLPTSTNGSSSLPMVLVDDTTQALGHLARYHRRRMGKPIIAITGSCGKTTTKELIAHLIGEPWAVLKTTGTQNNHIGAPLTLLRLEPRHEFGIIELGSNHPGEIAYLADIVEPDVAVITNVGPVHLEFLGSLMGVLQEKLSLLDALRAEGTAVVPGDQLDVCLEAPQHLQSGVRLVTFGATERCDIQAADVQRAEAGMAMRLRDDPRQWLIPMVGYHNVENVLAAVACAWAMGVPLSATRDRLRTFEPVPLRSEIVRCDGLTILNDCYNANPLSFARALETLRNLETRRHVAIVGDMLELGTYAPSAHQAIGRLASQLGIDAVIAVGEFADDVALGAREVRPDSVMTCRTVPELLERLPGMLQHGDGLLVKGSRKLNLEQVTDFLLQKYRGVHGELAQ